MLHNSYETLKEIITQRQYFEAQTENKVLPYTNHPTNNNFYDINGYTLLHYACQSGNESAVIELLNDPNINIELSPYLTKHKTTALDMALQAGYHTIAELLLSKGANCKHIKAASVHTNCKYLFNKIIRQSLNKSFPYLLEGNISKTSASLLFNGYFDTPYQRLTELGDLETLKKIESHWLDSASLINNIFMTATSNGHIHIIDYLFLLKKITFDSDASLFVQTVLHEAVQYRQHAIVKYLISAGHTINNQNEYKKTPLMLATENNDIEIVMLLLNNNADILLQDIHGNNVLHYAAKKNHQNIIDILINIDTSEQSAKIKNIYSLTAYDYKQHKNEIYQKKILLNMRYFLALLYRDITFFNEGGHCHGFAFLRNYYASIDRKSYYYNTLTLMSAWDGSLEALYAPFTTDLEQAKYHANLLSIYEQWTGMIIWLQSDKARNIYNENNQDNLKECFEIVRSCDSESIVTICDYKREYKFNRDQLNEHLSLIKKMPTGVLFHLQGAEHSTSGDVIADHKHIDYYDPNFSLTTDAKQINDKLDDIIIDIKFRTANKINQKNQFGIHLIIYYYNYPSSKINLDQFELFHDDALPKCKDDAKSYQENSPCKFTHLHGAAITGSVSTLEKLLNDDYCDITAKDCFDRTVADIIIANRNTEMMQLHLKYAPDKFNIEKALLNIGDLVKNHKDFLKTAIEHATPENHIAICINEIDSYQNHAYVINFILNNKASLNVLTKNSQSLLLYALANRKFFLIKPLIENGASILVKAKPVNLWDSDPNYLITPLEYVIHNHPEEGLEILLAEYATPFLPLLIAHSKNDTQEELNLLKQIDFDPDNIIHSTIFRILLNSAIKSAHLELASEIAEIMKPRQCQVKYL